MTHDFKQDYEALALDPRADWETAHDTYRRQVNLWHPDRFFARPRERVHAEQRFIQLTRSYDRLRNFYRQNHRLPFEPLVRHRSASLEHASAQDGDAMNGAPLRTDPPDTARGDGSPFDDDAMREAGILSARYGGSVRRRTALFYRLRWPLLGCLLAAGMLGTVFMLDRSQRQATLKQGHEVLRDAERSEFMPSEVEVQKRSSRGAFVEREDGRLGDQLMQDIFR